MRIGWLLGIVFAIALHAAFLLFGGALFLAPTDGHGALQEVVLLTEEDFDKDEESVKEQDPEESEELETETEAVPDAAEVIRNLDVSPIAKAPELEAASLSAIEAALNGQGGMGGDFSESLTFSSGGIIGGTGKAGGEGLLEDAFSLSEIDQKPRPIFQASPVYPAKMKSVEGTVTVIFIVDEMGRVVKPRVEKSSHREFEKPAVDAIKQWKFEPAIRGGKKVACKMRVPIRFQPR